MLQNQENPAFLPSRRGTGLGSAQIKGQGTSPLRVLGQRPVNTEHPEDLKYYTDIYYEAGYHGQTAHTGFAEMATVSRRV